MLQSCGDGVYLDSPLCQTQGEGQGSQAEQAFVEEQERKFRTGTDHVLTMDELEVLIRRRELHLLRRTEAQTTDYFATMRGMRGQYASVTDKLLHDNFGFSSAFDETSGHMRCVSDLVIAGAEGGLGQEDVVRSRGPAAPVPAPGPASPAESKGEKGGGEGEASALPAGRSLSQLLRSAMAERGRVGRAGGEEGRGEGWPDVRSLSDAALWALASAPEEPLAASEAALVSALAPLPVMFLQANDFPCTATARPCCCACMRWKACDILCLPQLI